VAQPPLYRVVYRNKENYIHDENALRHFVLDIGLKEVQFTRRGEAAPIETARLRQIIDQVSIAEIYLTSLEKKGMALERFLSLARGSELPLMQVTCEGVVHHFYTENEYTEFMRARHEQKGEGVTVHEDNGRPPEGDVDVRVAEYTEARPLGRILGNLAANGFQASEYRRPDSAEPLGTAIVGKEQVSVRDLSELGRLVRDKGQQAVSYQRFKGLGEMNAQQLWDTTMKPENRTLVRVRLDDAARADEIFSVLMGNNVEPRRQFLERYAREAKNLDI